MKGKKAEYILILAAVVVFMMSCVLSEQHERMAVSMDVIRAEQPCVALTFDDGPHVKYTPQLLDGLRERGVVATFFVIGESIEGKEDIIKQMSEDGHLIGSHTFTHVQLTKLPEDAAWEEIWKANDKIFDVIGEMPEYIRPPFGSWNETLACEVDMEAILWDVDPQDWKYKDTDRVVKHVISHVKNGDIILLHDIYQTSVDAALKIVDILKEQGYEFVTVDELLID